MDLRRFKKKRVFGHIETFQRHHLYIYICSTGDPLFSPFLPKIGFRELEEWIVYRNRAEFPPRVRIFLEAHPNYVRSEDVRLRSKKTIGEIVH